MYIFNLLKVKWLYLGLFLFYSIGPHVCFFGSNFLFVTVAWFEIRYYSNSSIAISVKDYFRYLKSFVPLNEFSFFLWRKSLGFW